MKTIDAIAHVLKAEGTAFITGFPHNQIFDGCAAAGIRPIITRTERVGINIADGFSRVSSGRSIGVTAVQYGPGIENGFGAIAQAYADASPVLVLPTGYPTQDQGIAPNFEVVRNLTAVTKAVRVVNRPERVWEILGHAYALLRTGRRGPVVVEVPDDVTMADASAPARETDRAELRDGPADAGQVKAVVDAILRARHPLLVAGQGVLYAEASKELVALANLLDLPVMTTLAGKSAFPENHPLALGTGGLSRPDPVAEFLARADLVVGVGTSFTRSDYTTQVPVGVPLVQITNDARDLAKNRPIIHGVIGDARAILAQLTREARRRTGKEGRKSGQKIRDEIARSRARFLEAWSDRLHSDAEPISPYRVITELMAAVDRKKTIVTHDSGNPRDQCVPFYEAIVPHGYIGWGKSTQLGTGLGLAMGAKLARPDWLAANVMGDAAFGMVGMDVETAVRNDIPILTVVLNNRLMGGYEHHLPVATKKYKAHLLSGDYVGVARALGAKGLRVERVADLAEAFRQAVRSVKQGEATLVEVITREEPVFPTGAAH